MIRNGSQPALPEYQPPHVMRMNAVNGGRGDCLPSGSGNTVGTCATGAANTGSTDCFPGTTNAIGTCTAGGTNTGTGTCTAGTTNSGSGCVAGGTVTGGGACTAGGTV